MINGFKLQSLIKDTKGNVDILANKELEYAWWEYGRACNGFITRDGGMGALDFDALILRTLIIDGEAFIRIYKNAKNPYGITFELLDGLQIDLTKNQKRTAGQNAIIMGIEVDDAFRPVRYWFREGDEDNYQVGQYKQIPADEVIHLYRKEFPNQTRRFWPDCSFTRFIETIG